MYAYIREILNKLTKLVVAKINCPVYIIYYHALFHIPEMMEGSLTSLVKNYILLMLQLDALVLEPQGE